MENLHSCRNIDALDRVGIATDRILAKRIHFVKPQTLPELPQVDYSRLVRSSRGIGFVVQTLSLGTPWTNKYVEIFIGRLFWPYLGNLRLYRQWFVLDIGPISATGYRIFHRNKTHINLWM
jgi:hypothetical protein